MSAMPVWHWPACTCTSDKGQNIYKQSEGHASAHEAALCAGLRICDKHTSAALCQQASSNLVTVPAILPSLPDLSSTSHHQLKALTQVFQRAALPFVWNCN
jgi:hypothetical protein